MHPAYSVIFLTTASGAGYGILIWMGGLAAAGFLPRDPGLAAAGFALALGLVSAGLLASTAHLGRPERAWRALSQWRSSWLSREGILSLATYVPAIGFGVVWTLHGTSGGAPAAWAIAAAVASAATVWCTAMIYASIAAVPAWYNAWVPPLYLVLSLHTGGLMLLLVADLFGRATAGLAVAVLAAALAAAACKWGYWRSVDRARPGSTAASATGLDGTVHQLARPHSGENFLLREMGYRVARRHAARLRRIAVAALFAVPVTALALHLAAPPAAGPWLAFAAALSASAGVLVERWLFFAEARHKVMLYYGDAAV